MATAPGKEFLNGFKVPSSVTEAYKVPSTLVGVVISHATIRNYGTTSEAFTIYMVPSGQSVANEFKAVVNRAIDPNETISLFEIISEPILTGGSIHAIASTATKLSLTVSGSEESAT